MRRFLMAGLSALALSAGAAGITACATTGGGETVAGRPAVDGKTLVATRRVNESQYRSIVADLFGADIELTGRFEPDQRAGGLLAIGSAPLSITSGGFEQYFAMGRSVGDQIFTERRRDQFATCKPADPAAPDDACTADFVRQYGRLLFRRPLTEAEVASRVEVARAGATQASDYYNGLKLALVSLMTSPNFLFRVESAEADPANPGALRLDGYTRASRLSFLLWNTAPDDELLTAAETGALYTEEGLAAQVARMTASPRLEQGFRALFTDVMQLELFDSVTKDATTYPKYSTTVAASAREQTLRTLVDHLVTRRADYRDIFTTPNTFIDRSLAAIYKLPFLTTSSWQSYAYPADVDQAGILTQVTFMSLFSHPGRSSPTKRGVALNEIFLCEETPLPPPNVDFSIVQDTANPLLKTVRARLLAHSTDETCAGCHNMTDPIGLALERYDGIGQHRPIEYGEPIDVSAELDGKAFEGARGLGQVLRDNPRVPACFVRNVYAYGVGRAPEETWAQWEMDFLEAETAAFAAGGYVAPDVIARIATSPEFFAVVFPAEPESGPDAEGADQTIAQSIHPKGRS